MMVAAVPVFQIAVIALLFIFDLAVAADGNFGLAMMIATISIFQVAVVTLLAPFHYPVAAYRRGFFRAIGAATVAAYFIAVVALLISGDFSVSTD